MKSAAKVFAVLLFAVSAVAFAAHFDGTYKFQSRAKEGKADMQGWQGTMTIKGDMMDRTYQSADGKDKKFYTSSIKQDGNVYILKHIKAYKPEHVGNEHRNKMDLKGGTLTLSSEDGKFKEVWTKK